MPTSPSMHPCPVCPPTSSPQPPLTLSDNTSEFSAGPDIDVQTIKWHTSTEAQWADPQNGNNAGGVDIIYKITAQPFLRRCQCGSTGQAARPCRIQR